MKKKKSKVDSELLNVESWYKGDVVEYEAEHLYDEHQLAYFASKLEKFELEVLRGVDELSHEMFLYRKTEVPNWVEHRRYYEKAWIKLEAMGLIKSFSYSNLRNLRSTVRGKQLLALYPKKESEGLENGTGSKK